MRKTTPPTRLSPVDVSDSDDSVPTRYSTRELNHPTREPSTGARTNTPRIDYSWVGLDECRRINLSDQAYQSLIALRVIESFDNTYNTTMNPPSESCMTASNTNNHLWLGRLGTTNWVIPDDGSLTKGDQK